MAVKYKHTCLLNRYDSLEVEPRIADKKETICFTMFEDDTKTTLTVYLDIKTSIRLCNSIRTEINEIKGI